MMLILHRHCYHRHQIKNNLHSQGVSIWRRRWGRSDKVTGTKPFSHSLKWGLRNNYVLLPFFETFSFSRWEHQGEEGLQRREKVVLSNFFLLQLSDLHCCCFQPQAILPSPGPAHLLVDQKHRQRLCHHHDHQCRVKIMISHGNCHKNHLHKVGVHGQLWRRELHCDRSWTCRWSPLTLGKEKKHWTIKYNFSQWFSSWYFHEWQDSFLRGTWWSSPSRGVPLTWRRELSRWLPPSPGSSHQVSVTR